MYYAMRAWAVVLLLIVGCSKRGGMDESASPTLRLVDDNGHAIVALDPDDLILDRTGKPIGRVEDRKSVV